MKKLLCIVLVLLPEFIWASDSLKLAELLTDKGLYSVVVLKNDRTIFKQSYHGITEKERVPIKSITKSVMSLLIGIALDRGFLKSLDQPISDFFPVLLTDSNTAKKRITIRHLMNHTSGLADYEDERMPEWLTDANPSAFLLSKPLVYEPGSTYRYNSPATHLLSAIITKATQMETVAFANEYLFKPLGIITYTWEKLPDGFYDGAGITLGLRTVDLAKIGNLVLHKGKINGVTIVSEQYIASLCDGNLKRTSPWGLPDTKVGLCWYQAKYENQEVNYCLGYGGQFLLVFPKLKCVIAATHDVWVEDPNWQSYDFMTNYLPFIYKAMVNVKD